MTINFDNKEALQHDVAVADSSGKVLGRTDLVSSGTAQRDGGPAARYLHLLLHRPGAPKAGMEGTLTVK